MKEQILKFGLATLIIVVTFSCKKEETNPWKIYTTNNGPADDIIYTIAKDSFDNIWFGGPRVISKFDGTKWTNYSTDIVSGFINAIAIDPLGIKWFGTEGAGVAKFDDTSWKIYNKSNSGLIGDGVNAIVIDSQGNKWFGTDFGISKFDGKNWTSYTNKGKINSSAWNSIQAISKDAQGNIWFGTAGGGVSKFDGANWTTFTTIDGLASNEVWDIAIDTQENKWFGTSQGVSKFDDINWTTYTTVDGLAYNYVVAIAIDSQGNKWFGTWDIRYNNVSGVSKFDGLIWTNYTKNNIVTTSLFDIAVDSRNNIWFGTGFGIAKLESGY